MASNFGEQKKKSGYEFLFFAAAAVLVIIIATWFGYILEDTATKKGIQWLTALNSISDYTNLAAFVKAFGAVFTGTGIAKKGMVLGFAGGMLIILWKFAGSGKRYHRKGEEHGSARWGNRQEKDIIADTNDFYNNVIAASDVFLVLDRKKRDTNSMTEKEKKAKARSDKKKEKNEKKRIDKLTEKAQENSPMGNLGEADIFETDKNTLVRYNGSDTEVTVPDNINKIGEFAFALSEVKSVTMSAVTDVEKGAFFGCEKLEHIEMEKAENIGTSAFERCYALSDIYVGDKFKKADTTSFRQCLNAVVHSPTGGYAEQYANQNDMTFELCGGCTDNEVISIRKIAEMRKAAAKIKPMLNLNMIILGGSGTGKSRFYVKPNIMQCNTSFVVTDPSGELLQSCGKMLERKGYKIKVFNINDMKHSSNYNPFHYLKDNDGNINSNNVIKMINTFMLNTKEEGAGGGDQFWTDATRLLLSSLCFLLVETASEEEQNFAGVLDLIHKAKVIEGKEEEKSDLDLMFDKRKEAEPNALSVQYYEEFKQAAGKTMQSILISTTTKLQCFKLEDVRNLTFADNIHLETMGDELTALFIIIPSTDTTYNFLAAMMYTQLFDALYNRAITFYHGRLKYHVRCLLDEFANCGKIPEFDKVLATCRKFEISAVIILQNLSQLKRLYEKSWEELPGNCDTMIYLGGKDQFTNEYLSKELGKETIDQQSINQTKGKQGSSSYNNAILGRELATIDELSTMDNNDCIVMVRGLHPFMTAKFDIINHPRYNMLDEANKAKNTYYLEDNIKTMPETEYVDFSRLYDNGTAYPDNTIEIGYVTSDNEIIKSAADLMSDIPQDIRNIFSDIEGVYAA